MPIPETENKQQNPEAELDDEYKKLEIKTGESSPRAVLESPISNDSSVSNSPTSSNNSNESMEKLSSPFNPFNYGFQLKGFIDTMKKKSGVRRLSTSTINLLSSYDISAKSLRKKLGRIRSAEDSIDFCLISKDKPCWRNFKYSELAVATHHFSPGMKDLV